METHLSSVMQGLAVGLGEGGEELGSAAEVHRIKKVYKIACAKGKGAGRGKESGEKDDRREIEAVVLGTMALKGE